ncbi:hypothetical protein FISHEDRAFT_76607 [Fistulina hepatica ATCC 64428]|uniref:Uncharacterized protein n=1 Tax=Fistulina hepatica ATCC 64428 TaxID=1128425 RepID=A0A0D7A692_9AGAR|nr:hypothetical protein FISHEDRAFT_76607 [Fistulina hepatica ATCC 64428]
MPSVLWRDATEASATAIPFAISSNPSVEVIIELIPLIAVGPLAICVFTFFLVMKRFEIDAMFLFTSASFQFASGLVDLAHRVTSDDTSEDTDDLTGTVIAREVLMSLATGFLFLYMWAAVARRPPDEPRVIRPVEGEITHRVGGYSHSASWSRWGVFGIWMKYFLASFCVVIVILQIIWRLMAKVHAPVCLVESSIEIVVTSIFIIKLLINVSLSPRRPISQSVRRRAIPLAAFLINLGIALGALITTGAFSQELLARFLIAVEVSFLSVHVLLSTFHELPIPIRPPRPTSICTQAPAARVVSQAQDGRTHSFSLSLDDQKFQEVASQARQRPGTVVLDDWIPPVSSRLSVSSRISSWLKPALKRQPSRNPISFSAVRSAPVSVEISDIARSGSVHPFTGIIPSSKANSRVQSMIDPVNVLSPNVQELKVNDALPSFLMGMNHESGLLDPTDTSDSMDEKRINLSRPDTEISLPSYYGGGAGSQRAESTPAPPSTRRQGTLDSPIYRLEHVVKESDGPGGRPVTDISLGSYYGVAATSTRSSLIPDFPGLPRLKSHTDSPVYGLDGIRRTSLRFSSQLSTSSMSRNSETSLDELLRQQNELDKTIAALKLLTPRASNATSLNNVSDTQTDDFESSMRPSLPPLRASITSRSTSTRSMFSLSNFPEPPIAESTTVSVNTLSALKLQQKARPGADEFPTSADVFDDEGSKFPVCPSTASSPCSPEQNSTPRLEITSFIGDAALDNGVRKSSEQPRSSEPSQTLRPPDPPASKFVPRPFMLLNNSVGSSSTLGRGAPSAPAPDSRRSGKTVGRPVISRPRSIAGEEEPAGAFERPRPPPLILTHSAKYPKNQKTT